MKVICISGHAQNGKDTVAQIARKYLWGFGKKVLIIHNADLLKFVLKQFFHWNGEKDDRGRTLLQYVGTDVIRAQNPDFWVGFIASMLRMFDSEWDYVLIPDCRFPNEISVLRDAGFDVIHVNVIREGFDNGLSQEQLEHPSETAMDDIIPEATIQNNGTLADLTKAVIDLMYPLYAAEEAKNGVQVTPYELA